MYFVFKRVLLYISTHVLAPRHSFSYTFQKVVFKDELFGVNMLHYFLLFTCLLMQQNTFENKIHTCYEIKQLNVKTCFCVFKV